MAEEFVDVANVSIEHSGGLVLLQDVKSIRVRTRRETKRVTTMNKLRRGRGFRRGPKECEVDLVSELNKSPEVDWNQIYDDEEVFQLYWERADNGQRRWALDCTIADIEEEEDDEGEASLSISIMALDNLKLK